METGVVKTIIERETERDRDTHTHTQRNKQTHRIKILSQKFSQDRLIPPKINGFTRNSVISKKPHPL